MNMFKKNGGFTLVELIVVIAILAILAAVAVPAYNGYIKEANNAAAETELTAISTAAIAANATAGQVTSITVNKAGDTVTFDFSGSTQATDFADDFELFYGKALENGELKITATNAWKGSIYAEKNGAKWTPTTGWEKVD